MIKRIILVLTMMLVAASAGSPKVFAQGSGTQCQQLSVPVRLSTVDPTIYNLAGWLCATGSLQGKTLQIVTHGLSYDHTYWDSPLDPQKYSYVRQATDAGYATFAVDTLGAGQSDHPVNASSVTVEAQAFVSHQLVQGFRAGTIGSTAFTKVMGVGHSFGSGITLEEAATYHDVDGVILSGFMHQPNPDAFGLLARTFYPAQQDPKFANAGLGPDYFTTVPETRSELFYNPADADPAIIAQDETLKQTAPSGELATVTDATAPGLSNKINVPVFIAVGQFDVIFCNPNVGLNCDSATTLNVREAQYFAPHACLETFLLPNAAHSINMHTNAHDWFEAASNWANRRVGPDTNHAPTQPCQ